MPGLTRSKGNQGFVPKILILIFHISTKKLNIFLTAAAFASIALVENTLARKAVMESRQNGSRTLGGPVMESRQLPDFKVAKEGDLY